MERIQSPCCKSFISEQRLLEVKGTQCLSSPGKFSFPLSGGRQYLGLLKVQVLADGGEQPAQALQGLLVVVLEQLHHTVVHDGFGQHLQLKKLPNELDVAQGAPPGLVPSFVQLLLQASSLLGLRAAQRQRLAQPSWDVFLKILTSRSQLLTPLSLLTGRAHALQTNQL